MKKGYSLLEVLIVAGLIAVVTAAILNMSNTFNLSWDTQNVRMELDQQARRGMDEMIRDLYQATSGQTTVNANSVNFRLPVVINDDSPNPPDIYDAQGNIHWGAGGVVGDSITYRITSGQLVRDVVRGINVISTRVCANNVASLNLSQQPLSPQLPRNIVISIICQKPVRRGSPTLVNATLQLQVTLRN